MGSGEVERGRFVSLICNVLGLAETLLAEHSAAPSVRGLEFLALPEYAGPAVVEPHLVTGAVHDEDVDIHVLISRLVLYVVPVEHHEFDTDEDILVIKQNAAVAESILGSDDGGLAENGKRCFPRSDSAPIGGNPYRFARILDYHDHMLPFRPLVRPGVRVHHIGS
jgi:hypothetical protein